MLNSNNAISPVSHQNFVWVADYVNGSNLCEYDFNTKQKNDFYKIDKSNLLRFGLVGQQMKLFFDTNTGKFNLNGMEVLISYKTELREYNLTGFGNGYYNDIITYKDAYTDANLINPNGKFSSHIHQYNFGFKKKIVFDDGIEFAFQAIVSLPYNSPAFIEMKLVANMDLDGQLYIKKIGGIAESLEIPLREGYAGVIEWVIK